MSSDRGISRTWGLKQNTDFHSAVTSCNTGRKKFHRTFAKNSCEKRKIKKQLFLWEKPHKKVVLI